MTKIYLKAMEVGDLFRTPPRNQPEWTASKHGATLAHLTSAVSCMNHVTIPEALSIVLEDFIYPNNYDLEDHGNDDFTRGYLAGQILGYGTDAIELSAIAEDLWHNGKYNQYQDALEYVKNANGIWEETIQLSQDDLKFIRELLLLTGNEIYQKYGLKRDESITHTAVFPCGIEADIKLVICDNDDRPYIEGILFDHGCEVACEDCSESYTGDWEFEYNNFHYIVHVK